MINRLRTRSHILTTLCILFASPVFEHASGQAPNTLRSNPVPITAQPQLFLHDDILIAKTESLVLTSSTPRKQPDNPVLIKDRPWERGVLNHCFSVIHDADEGIYKMWYTILDFPEGAPDQGWCLYATSKDGLRWHKPMLGLIEFDKSKENNIVFGNPKVHLKNFWVIKDYADPDPQRRYKMMYHLWDFRGRGVSIAHSPDGIHWTASQYNNLLGGFDTYNTMFWDDRIGQYAAYLRAFRFGKRYAARATSPDGYHWSHPVIVLGPDAQDPPTWELYTPSVFKSSQAANTYISVGAGFDVETHLMDGRLALSRDGIEWFRFREPFLRRGGETEWDSGTVWPVPSTVVVNGQTAIYYRGNNRPHIPEGERQGRAGIGVAFIDQDAFAGWRALREGTLTTTPLLKTDRRPILHLNADASQGEIRVEVLDANGKIVPGFSRSECEPITRRGPRLAVKWKPFSETGQTHDRLDHTTIENSALTLRLHLRNATVFGFQLSAK